MAWHSSYKGIRLLTRRVLAIKISGTADCSPLSSFSFDYHPRIEPFCGAIIAAVESAGFKEFEAGFVLRSCTVDRGHQSCSVPAIRDNLLAGSVKVRNCPLWTLFLMTVWQTRYVQAALRNSQLPSLGFPNFSCGNRYSRHRITGIDNALGPIA